MLSYALSGFLMSFVVVFISGSKQIRNVAYSALIVIFFILSNLLCFNSTNTSKDLATQSKQDAEGYHKSGTHTTKSEPIARSIFVKQIQTEGILSSVLLFVSAIFGGLIYNKLCVLKIQKNNTNMLKE